MRIDQERLNDQIDELGQFGYTEGKGITRPALSDAHLKAREWLQKQMHQAGMEVRVDGAGNVIGRLPAAEEIEDPQTVVIGSHLDTVPQGGKFDGALGVLGGVECARILKKEDVFLPWNLEVVDFTDEEGYHYAGTFGSRAMLGKVTEQELHQTKTEDVPTLAERFNELGWELSGITEARRSPDEFRAYFEMHVEQSSRMETRGLDVAAVTGIVGIYRYTVEIQGEANHAGTTPMADRNDALVAASDVFRLLPEWARARSQEMVATVGQVSVEPGAQNIIPGICRFSVELRSLQSQEMIDVRNRLKDWLEENCQFSLTDVLEKDGVYLDDELIDLVLESASECGLESVALASGAGHDAQSFAPHVPTGMLFIPSADGFSHSPREYSKPEWVANGANVLLKTVHNLAARDADNLTD